MAKADRMRLLDNRGEDHQEAIEAELKRAKRALFIIAFAKRSGLKSISALLSGRIGAGMAATFVIGIDFYQSEPEVLRSLLRLKNSAPKGKRVAVYMGRKEAPGTLHPKVYFFNGPGGASMIIGSANLTSGGLSDNHEMSALLGNQAADWEGRLDEWISKRLKAKDIVEANDDLIDAYEQERDIYRTHMALAERRIRRSLRQPRPGIDTLAELLTAMRREKGEASFERQCEMRRKSLRSGGRRLAELGNAKGNSRAAFLAQYEALIRTWHSGGLDRAKTRIADNRGKLRAAVLALRRSTSDDPATLFDLLSDAMIEVPGAGINAITEMLHTRDPVRFPVMNQNSIAGMKLAGFTGYPKYPTKRNVTGVTYARFKEEASRLRQELGLPDFSALDALFNYSYWKD